MKRYEFLGTEISVEGLLMIIGESYAVLHFQAGVDGYDVEFLLGGKDGSISSSLGGFNGRPPRSTV